MRLTSLATQFLNTIVPKYKQDKAFDCTQLVVTFLKQCKLPVPTPFGCGTTNSGYAAIAFESISLDDAMKEEFSSLNGELIQEARHEKYQNDEEEFHKLLKYTLCEIALRKAKWWKEATKKVTLQITMRCSSDKEVLTIDGVNLRVNFKEGCFEILDCSFHRLTIRRARFVGITQQPHASKSKSTIRYIHLKADVEGEEGTKWKEEAADLYLRGIYFRGGERIRELDSKVELCLMDLFANHDWVQNE